MLPGVGRDVGCGQGERSSRKKTINHTTQQFPAFPKKLATPVPQGTCMGVFVTLLEVQKSNQSRCLIGQTKCSGCARETLQLHC